jgi:hypothetical protein
MKTKVKATKGTRNHPLCESCGATHKMGSGRFCSIKCSRSYAAKVG